MQQATKLRVLGAPRVSLPGNDEGPTVVRSAGGRAAVLRLPLMPVTSRACLALAAILTGCSTLPAQPTVRALYADLRKMVDIHQTAPGWVVDRLEVEALASSALHSTCQANRSTRSALAEWLQHRIDEEGGLASEIYARTHDLDDAEESLSLERVHKLLIYADQHSAQDCPFWLQPQHDFKGDQSDEHRAVLLLESNGIAALLLERGGNAVGGGGGARVLLGYGFSHRITVAFGGEFGGTADLVEDPVAGNATVDAAFTAALPLLLRVRDVARVYDFEIAPTTKFLFGDQLLPPGFRVALGGGLTALRTQGFMPYGAVWLGYEFQPARGTGPATHSLLAGARVGVDVGL
ncbi:MAG: hypothetical protein MJD61_22075 [Proteobacteria bacterium]|nr:hypothetical protein [Pseudomonadota bacterium]